LFCALAPLSLTSLHITASALDLETLDFAAHQRAGKMYSYQKACFSEATAAVRLGIAVDDGRVAREPWKLGAFVRPDTGFAGWMAPKARAQHLHSKRVSKHKSAFNKR